MSGDMTDYLDDCEAEGGEISRLVTRWPETISAAEKAVRASEKVLGDLIGLYDIELVEGPDADDASSEFAEIRVHLRNIRRIAQIRLAIEREWQAAVRKQREAETAGGSPESELTTQVVRDALLLVPADIPYEVIDGWTDAQREAAAAWATTEHLHASDNGVQRLPKPAHVSAVQAPDKPDSPASGSADCTCYRDCRDCSLTGEWHVHPGEPCPVHPDAPGDR